MSLELVPLSLADARRYVAEHHRHNEPPRGHKFSIGLANGAGLAGVVVAGRPSSRQLDDGRTLELLRLTTTGERNACSRLYAAACRAAWALGYRRVVTYTLEEEPGTSLRAAGFRRAELTRPRTAGREWHRSRVAGGSRLRLWDEAKMPMGRKVRWERCAP